MSHARSVSPQHRVVVLAMPHCVAFEVGLPHRFLASPTLLPAWRPDLSADDPALRLHPAPYVVDVVTPDDNPVLTSAGYLIAPTVSRDALAEADSVAIPGTNRGPLIDSGRLDPEVIDALALVRDDARWLTICTGAFVVAALGMLEGRRATTHWMHADAFRQHFPTVHLDESVLYVDHGDVVTSAGNAAGIDMLLHVVRTEHGVAAANRVARGANVAPMREGGQAQFIAAPAGRGPGGSTSEVRAWALDHLTESLDVAQLATRAGMSVRTFTRRFRDETGETAAAWVARQRLDEARRLLETTDLPVESVAQRSGFGSAVSLRTHLAGAIGVSPAAYRRTYRGAFDLAE